MALTIIVVVIHDHCHWSMFGDLHRLVGVQSGTNLPPVQVIEIDDHLGVTILGLHLLDSVTRLQGRKCVPVDHKATGELDLHYSHIGALLRLADHGHKTGTGRKVKIVRMGVPIYSGIKNKARPGTGDICIVFVADLG